MDGDLQAPFPWFGGKSRAVSTVWAAFGQVDNYVEPFAGSAAMLLGAPEGRRNETINDKDGFVANFWRAIAAAPEDVARHADWPCNEIDLEARHSWLVREAAALAERLQQPDYFDAKIAGWWVWGACNWIGGGWCSGDGPWMWDGERLVDSRKLPHLSAGQGINRKLPHLSAGQGINRQLPHLSAGQGINRQLPLLSRGQGINRQLPHLSAGRGAFIRDWFEALADRLREVRMACGDWSRVVSDSVTTRHGRTAVFLDPPYTDGDMDYAVGGVGGELAAEVRAWCLANGENPLLRIVLCGHAGEHDALIEAGWHTRKWQARKGYARTDDAVARYQSETVWCSPHCVPVIEKQAALF